MSLLPPTVVIENVRPLVDGGRYPVKRAVGEDLTVYADIFKDGHDVVLAVLKWRKVGARNGTRLRWNASSRGRRIHWRGTCAFFDVGAHDLTIEAWGDTFRSWQHEFATKFAAHEPNLTSETLEGAKFVEAAAERALATRQKRDGARLQVFADRIRRATPEQVNALAHDGELEALMTSYADRSESTEFVLGTPDLDAIVDRSSGGKAAGKKSRAKSKSKKEPFVEPPAVVASEAVASLRYPRVWVDRERALFASWYEFFPRSAEGRSDRGSTFRDCLPRVDDARAMGFDVIYFLRFHPIGVTARKGKNNSVDVSDWRAGGSLCNWQSAPRLPEWRWTSRCRPGTWHAGRFRLARAADSRARDGGRPGLCAELLA
jgi:starch synthase (maltosyl-transferring)